MSNKKRIFIADDDVEIISILEKSLTSHDFEVKATQNSKDAIPMIKAFKPDLILLDLLMSNVGGFEICEILNKDEETQGIPIIVISALMDQPDIKKAYQLGVVSYLTKPLILEDLLRHINTALANKEGA